MEIYLVGGAVRDMLMGSTIKDYDYVVVGSSVEEMLKLGYKQVGADFPVFLDHLTGHEHALARTERKSGEGYKGFEVETKGVTLEDDLMRRDLTINAIAMAYNTPNVIDGDWNIIDPLNGVEDIRNRILRHANEKSFAEDPLRVLRLARFCARFPEFMVAKETIVLCRHVVESGELLKLTPERVAMEMEKALRSELPSRFFYFLNMIGALEQVFPEIFALVGKTQPYMYHPEGDAFIHTMMVLDEAAKNSDDMLDRFCALTHDLGKGETPEDILPHHYGHEARGVHIIDRMCDRLKLTNEMRNHAKLVSKYHTHIHNWDKLNSKTIVKMYEDLKVNQNKEITRVLPFVSKCDARGRTSFYAHNEYLQEHKAGLVFNSLPLIKASNVCTPEEIESGNVNVIKDKIYRARIAVVISYK